MSKRGLIYLIFSLIIFSLIMITSCSQQAEKKNEPIKIGLTGWPGYAYVYIAQEKGFFKNNNVDVELKLTPQAAENFGWYKNGETDAFLDPLSNAIDANDQGIRTKIVYAIDYSDEGDVIVGKSSFASLADLKGKKIGFEGINSFSHIFVVASMQKAGLKESDYELKNVAAQDVPDLMAKGEIDAGHTWEPAKSMALSQGSKILAKAGDIPGLIIDVFGVKAELVEKRPDDIRAIIKSMNEAREFFVAHPDEGLEIMSRGTGIPIEELKSGIAGARQLNLEENVGAMQQDGSVYNSAKITIDFYTERGQLSKIPDLSNIIDPTFVEGLATGNP